jgi:hypothetical protein
MGVGSGVGSGSINQRCGSGSASKCHGFPTLYTTLFQVDRFVRAHNDRRGRSQQQQQQEEEAGREPPTSGAEEVDRILTEARRRYGRIRPTAFRENIDAQNISVILPKKGQPQQPDISEVDKAATKIAKTIFRAPPPQSSKRSRVGVKKGITTSSSSSLTSSSKEESTTSSLSRDRTPSSSRTVLAEESEEGEEVNVRIPLDEASINLRIRTRGDQEDRRHPLAGRRIHVRVRNLVPIEQCCESVTFVKDPDPALFVSAFQDVNKK